ncbi:MAG: hypothetical protein EZS28_007151 [Streblomastix strix]|uniref:Uncharacterized protein n=1 Tax=Streblomastix strix TaxID=222440 RepID=A0A5J4WS16_9EUKA|nr:MAG: hypothetical protein EZS28_007151 [Streblomastix strix]
MDRISEDDNDLVGLSLAMSTRIQFGGDQCDLNLSPVQSRCQIIELIAAKEIDRPERLNTKSTLEHIQDYLVRTGIQRYNPGPKLFHQVLESDICYHKEERRLEEDPGQSNSELRIKDRSSGRDATVSMLQLQWSLLQLQWNAIWSLNGFENLYQMPLPCENRGQEAIQLENFRIRRRYSNPEFGSHKIASRDTASNEDSTRIQIDECD